MADFTLNLSGTTELDNSLVQAFAQSYWVANGQNNMVDQFAQTNIDVGAKSVEMTKYARLALATTALSEREDTSSTAMADTSVIITPAEYGNVVTTTNLANLQSGGKANLGAAEVVGINHGSTMDKLGLLALDASTNVLTVNGGAGSTQTASDIVSDVFLNSMYNKLSRANVPMVNGAYVMIAHDDVIADLREATAVGSWTDVSKYAAPETVLQNEVGMYKGFRVIRDNNSLLVADGGSTTVDLYNSYFFGANAFGKGTSQPGRMVITGPFDKLARFVNVGWYEVSNYKIIDQDCIWVGQSASSKGTNV